MILLSVSGLRKHFGPEPVLDGVTFDVRSGERVALVGPNGAGKTTLLHIIAGLQEADAGQVARPSLARVGLLEQQPDFPAGRTVWEEARHALRDLIQLREDAERAAHALSHATDDGERREWAERYDQLQHELHHRDAYEVDHRIERVLQGLGFSPPGYGQPVSQLSGGQQNRLLLARLLLEAPDVMLLDEPSNHLDIQATEWLETYLVESQPALVVVSHDRYFLDQVTTRTLELVRGTVDSYAGNYSAYVPQKSERLEVQRRTYERQQVEIAKMEDFVRRHHHGLKHAQAEDRRKKLERIEPVPAPREIAAPPMGFPPAARSGDVVIRVERLCKAYDQPLFADLQFDILRGEKWGVLGPNGSGKTTLLRCILGEVEADAGQVTLGSGVPAGYFDQQLLCLNPDQEVHETVRPDHKDFVEQQRRDLLARFGVTGDMALQKIGSLSGGERNRAALARLAASDANLLILDEPTNHLDLWARGALEKALRQFDGTVLFVSHDRYFLNQVADHMLVVQPGSFRVVDGNYDTYCHLVRQGLVADDRGARTAQDTDETRRRQRRAQQPQRRKRRFPYRKLADLESDIANCEARIEEIYRDLASPQLLRDGHRVKQAQAELETQQERLAQLYEHWEEASELN